MTQYNLTYGGDPKVIKESMAKGGQLIFTGFARALPHLSSMVQYFFAPIGGMVTIFAILFALGASDPFQSWLPLTVMPFALAFLLLGHAIYSKMAVFSARSSFGQSSALTIDASGLVLTTEHSTWTTGWADVEAVTRSKNTVGFLISAIVIPVPATAFDDIDQAEVEIRKWWAAAHGASS